LDKTGEFALMGGVKDADREAVFEELAGFGEAFALEGEGGPAFFEGTVDGGRADGQELIPDSGSDAERRPLSDEVHLPTDEGGQELRIFGSTAFIPEERPDEAEGGDDLVGIDFLAEAVGRFFSPASV
jgi:hypothetical protein